MRVEIRRLQRRLGTTSLYVTHDQLEAMTLADRLVVMNEGRVEQIGTPVRGLRPPGDRSSSPASSARPPMNILPADYLAARGSGGLPSGADLFGVRPDDLMLAPPAEPHLALPATLELLEPAGAEAHLYLRLDGLDMPVTLRAQGRPEVTEGAPLTLYLRPETLHGFERESGRRVV